MTTTKILEIIVVGESIGKIKLQLNGRSTIVEGAGIISTGEFDMKAEEIEEMVYKRTVNNYKDVNKKDIEIKSYEA